MRLIFMLSLMLVSCGDNTALPKPQGFCQNIVRIQPNRGAHHVAESTPIQYADNPPSSGPHYPIWARYEAYSNEVPEGYWVHNLEHGAVVFLYRDNASATVQSELQDVYDSLNDDNICGHTRALLTANSHLQAEFAVVAWDHVLVANCVDQEAIFDFVKNFRNHGPENVCAQGSYAN